MKTGRVSTRYARISLLYSLFAGASLIGLAPSVNAQCFGYPESMGCTVNGVPNQICVGTKTTGNVIVANNGCSNPNDSPVAGTGVCVIRGLSGGDVIKGIPFDRNVICGGSGADVLLGGQFNDIEFGGDGNDVMVGGASSSGGTNLLDGGAGNDTLVVGGGGFGGDASNFNFGGSGTRDVCESGFNGFNSVDCEVKIQ